MILNPDLYKQAKAIADDTYKTHGAYKSAFLVKKYKELGGEYADDGKPRNLRRWLKEEWKDVAGLPYPVYRPTKRISEATPLTASEIEPESLVDNAFRKQVYTNRRNLPPFVGKTNEAVKYSYSAPYSGGYLGGKRMMGGDLGPTYPTFENVETLYSQIRNILTEDVRVSQSQRLRAMQLLSDFGDQWTLSEARLANLENSPDDRDFRIWYCINAIKTFLIGLPHFLRFIRPGYILPKEIKNFVLDMQELEDESDPEELGKKAEGIGSGIYKMPDGCSLYTGGALTTKRATEFSQSVQDIFNLLSVSRKYKIIGSGALQEIKYSADYDLNEVFKDEISDKKSALDRLYKVFRDKFIEAKEDPDVWITDFKCGEDSDGEPLRWSYEDMMRGYKRMTNGRLISFQECILMKATLKLDVIAIVDGRFVEFSDNYFIKLDKDANFFPHDLERDHLLNSIKHDYSFQMFSAGNFFKGLKRAFAYYKLEGEGKNDSKIQKLLEFFNSETGLLYKIRSELKTIQMVLEQTFRKPKIDQIHTNIRLILEQLHGQSAVSKLLSSALMQRTPKSISQYLEKASEILYSDINKSTTAFVSQNKNLLLI
jgi:hypothetical protein